MLETFRDPEHKEDLDSIKSKLRDDAELKAVLRLMPNAHIALPKEFYGFKFKKASTAAAMVKKIQARNSLHKKEDSLPPPKKKQ